MKVRPATNADRDAIWKIFHEVVASGDTYPLGPNISRKDALAYWFQPAAHTYVAELDGLKPSSSRQRYSRLRIKRTIRIEATELYNRP